MRPYGRLLLAILAMGLFTGGYLQAKNWELTDEERAECASLAEDGFHEWQQVRWEKILPPSADTKELPYLLNVAIIVYNHQRGLDAKHWEGEINYHLQRAREAYRPCGIEVAIESSRFLEGPKFLNSLDRDPDNEWHISEKERCLLEPTFKPGLVNVYFVDNVQSKKGKGGSHAISDQRFDESNKGTSVEGLEEDQMFVGAVMITNDARSSTLSDGRSNPKQPIVFAHEIGHVVTGQGHTPSQEHNLMNDDLDRASLDLNETQCELARESRFVHSR